MDILQNIAEVAKNKGLTLTEIERECGFSKSSMRKWSENIPSVGKIMTVAEYLGVSVDRILRTEENAKRCIKKLEQPLLTESEEELLKNYRKVSQESKLLISERARTLAELEAAKTLTETKQVEVEQDNEEEDNFIYLDMYDMPVSAGKGAYIDYATAETVQVTKTYETEQANYMVRISGDSMEPRFEDKDVVLVETTAELSEGDIGIFILNGEAYIKQLGKNCLISLNSKYQPIPINEYDNCVLKGRVIGVLDIRK